MNVTITNRTLIAALSTYPVVSNSQSCPTKPARVIIVFLPDDYTLMIQSTKISRNHFYNDYPYKKQVLA